MKTQPISVGMWYWFSAPKYPDSMWAGPWLPRYLHCEKHTCLPSSCGLRPRRISLGFFELFGWKETNERETTPSTVTVKEV